MKLDIIVESLLAVCTILLIWVFVPWSSVGAALTQGNIQIIAIQAGIFGPLAIIGLMWLAVVASPIPSAPVAIAAGALYGHTVGAIYVAIGAELGAVTAFLIARYFARDAVSRWTKGRLEKGLLGSQNALTWTVFLSRLMPFVSFDAFSYAAGVSRIHFWRFAIATLVGIIPASVVLAHIGTSAITGDVTKAGWIAMGLGFATAASVALGTFWAKYKGNTPA